MQMPLHTVDAASAREREEEREARVFRELERNRQYLAARSVGAVVILSSNRPSFWQRLTAWHLSRRHSMHVSVTPPLPPAKEPQWPRHWATRKYL